MKSRTLNVYILNDNTEEAGKLRKYLLQRFHDLINVSLFFNRRSFFNMLDNDVDLVVVNDYHGTKPGPQEPHMQVLEKIKKEHPSTEVVILSSHASVGNVVEALNKGARDIIPNKKGAWSRVRRIIDQSIQQPIRYLIAEYGVNVFMAVFALIWTALGIISYLALRYWV